MSFRVNCGVWIAVVGLASGLLSGSLAHAFQSASRADLRTGQSSIELHQDESGRCDAESGQSGSIKVDDKVDDPSVPKKTLIPEGKSEGRKSSESQPGETTRKASQSDVQPSRKLKTEPAQSGDSNSKDLKSNSSKDGGSSKEGASKSDASKDGGSKSSELKANTSDSGRSKGDKSSAETSPGKEKAGEKALREKLTQKGNPKAFEINPEQEARALEFASQHHPELVTLLVPLKTTNPKEYQRGVRELFRSSERLEQVRQREKARYDLELEAWKLNSQVRLLAARLIMDPDPELQEQLREALRKRADNRLRSMKFEKESLQNRLTQLNRDIEKASQSQDVAVEQEFDRLVKRNNRDKALLLKPLAGSTPVNSNKIKPKKEKAASSPESDIQAKP